MSDTSDRNYRSFVREKNRTIGPGEWNTPIRPEDYDDLFKCSECENFGAEDLYIPGGSREDAIDCVRGADYHFRRCIVGGTSTLKGAIAGWLYEDSEVHGQIEVGQFDNYWKLGARPTRGGVIRRTYHPGGRVKVVLWNAETPAIEGSDVQITRIPWVVWFPYFCWRYVAIRTWDRPAPVAPIPVLP